MPANQLDDAAIPDDAAIHDDQANADAALREKFSDAMTPGYEVEFDPEEAARAGAFREDALSEADAAESADDLPEGEADASPK
jgi:hypothetical protein